MTRPALALTIPCSICKAASGSPCIGISGQPVKRNHMKRRADAPCGTDGGYQRHRKAGEAPCAPCREAIRRKQQQRRIDRPDERERDVERLRARNRAANRLVKLHADEFKQLIEQEMAS